MIHNTVIQQPDEWLPPEFFQRVPNEVVNDLRRGKLKAIDIAVYMVLVKHLGENDRVWVGNPTIARLIGRELKTVNRSIERLQAADYIARPTYNQQTGTKNTFILKRVVGGRVVRMARRPVPVQAARAAEQGATASRDIELSKDELDEFLAPDRRDEDEETSRPELSDEL